MESWSVQWNGKKMDHSLETCKLHQFHLFTTTDCFIFYFLIQLSTIQRLLEHWTFSETLMFTAQKLETEICLEFFFNHHSSFTVKQTYWSCTGIITHELCFKGQALQKEHCDRWMNYLGVIGGRSTSLQSVETRHFNTQPHSSAETRQFNTQPHSSAETKQFNTQPHSSAETGLNT